MVGQRKSQTPSIPVMRRCLAGGAILLLLVAMCLAPATAAEPAVKVKVTSPKQFQQVLAQHKGKVVLVDYWATWCVPCIKGFPHTVELHEKYAGKGLVVVSVSMDDPDEDTQTRVLAFLKKRKAAFPNYISSLGGEEEALQAFGIKGGALPYYQLYDRQGKPLKDFGADPNATFSHKDIETAVVNALSQR